MNRQAVKNKTPGILRALLVLVAAWGGLVVPLHAITCTNVVPVTTIDPSGGAGISFQNPNWTTAFKSYCSETFSSVTALTMQQTGNVAVLNFETANGFPAATKTLTSSGVAFTGTNTISPFAISSAVTGITTTNGYSIGVQYRYFDSAHNVMGAADATQGVFLVGDRMINDTMVSGTQGLVAGEVYYQNSGGGGMYLTFDRNLSQFGVALKANSLSTTDIICLFDADGVLVAKYSVGISAGSALFFGVKSQNSVIRSVWIGQSTSTNGLIVDDISFVPAPASTTPVSYSFAGSSAMNGWSRSSGATTTTSADHLTIQSSNWDSKIYRTITLSAGTYTMTGTGSGAILVQMTTSWSSPYFAVLNLSQSSGWRNDRVTFSSNGGGALLVVQVNSATSTASIQSLAITSTTLTPFTPDKSALLTEKTNLGRARGMNSTWNNTGSLGTAYYAELKTWGCNIVRLQLHPVSYAQSKGKDFWTAWPTYRGWMVENIQQAQAAGLKTVIDLHELPFTDSPPTNKTNWSRDDLGVRFQTVWQDIAQTIVNNNLTSAVWAYELINEPLDNSQMPNKPRQWWPLAANTINTIRTVDPTTWIVYDVGPGSLMDGFNNLRPLPDNHVIYSGHFYYPSSFAMQGVTDGNIGIHYSSSSTNLATYLLPADTFAAAWPVPIYVGEFSVARWGPVPDTKNWLNDLTKLFETRQWSWCYFAWAEWNGWRLDMDNSYTPTSAPAPFDDNHRTDRGLVIYNVLQSSLTVSSPVTSFPPNPVAAVSRRTHGAGGDFDMPIGVATGSTFTGSSPVECREGTVETIVVTMDKAVVSGAVYIAGGNGTIGSLPTFNGNTMTIRVTGVTNAQTLQLSLNNVTAQDGTVLAKAIVSMKVLAGDVNGDGAVNTVDVSAIKAAYGFSAGQFGFNYRADLNADGSVTTVDVNIIKNYYATQVP